MESSAVDIFTTVLSWLAVIPVLLVVQVLLLSIVETRASKQREAAAKAQREAASRRRHTGITPEQRQQLQALQEAYWKDSSVKRESSGDSSASRQSTPGPSRPLEPKEPHSINRTPPVAHRTAEGQLIPEWLVPHVYPPGTTEPLTLDQVLPHLFVQGEPEPADLTAILPYPQSDPSNPNDPNVPIPERSQRGSFVGHTVRRPSVSWATSSYAQSNSAHSVMDDSDVHSDQATVVTSDYMVHV